MSITFVAMYRGKTISEATLVAVTTDPDLVSVMSTRLLGKPVVQHSDPVVTSLEQGRRAALRLIKREASIAITSKEATDEDPLDSLHIRQAPGASHERR